MKRYLVTVIVLLIVSTASWGRSIELEVHDKALGFNYINRDSILIDGMGVEAGLLLVESVKPLFYLGLNVEGQNVNKQGTFDIILGGRFYNMSESGMAYNAIALGGKVRFSPLVRVGLGGHLYYAPDVTTFGDSNGLTDLMVRLDYQVIPQAFTYIGYRKIGVKFPGSTSNLENNFHIGLKLLY